MGCFCSKGSSGRVCDDMCDPSWPTLINLINGNASIQLSTIDAPPAIVRTIDEFPEDGMGNIMLSQARELQVIPVEGYPKKFALVRGIGAIQFVAEEGDVVIVNPFWSSPEVVLVEQGCHLQPGRIRILLERWTYRHTAREIRRFRRRGHHAVGMARTSWDPNHHLLP